MCRRLLAHGIWASQKTLEEERRSLWGSPLWGRTGARALGGGRSGERSEPKSTTPCDRSEGGRGDAGLGMRENSECNRCFSRMLKTAYRQAIRVISIKQRASKEAPKRLISGSPRGADGSEVAWLVGAHGERSEPKSDRYQATERGGRGLSANVVPWSKQGWVANVVPSCSKQGLVANVVPSCSK